MKKELENDLKRIEKYAVKVIKGLKRMDLDYTVQASINSVNPKNIVYATSITPPATGLAPLTFISHKSADDLIEKLKVASKNIDYEAVEVAYHKAQIISCENTIVGHKERIEEIENPVVEETAGVTNTTEDEVKDEQPNE